MYFPYLRGRQYELLAIRELSNNKKLKNIIPIIEPVKVSSTLVNTLETLVNNSNTVVFIVNPQVGNYLLEKSEKDVEEKAKAIDKLVLNNKNILKGIIASSNSRKYRKYLDNNGIDSSEIVSVFLDSNYINDYETTFKDGMLYNVIPYDLNFRQYKSINKSVMIEDRFISQERNSDYKNQEDEFFSNDIDYYSLEGYVGFSDYSIVGKEYQDGGFAPYAVAIHIIYKEKDSLRIHHFVSDRDEGISDTAGKYYEALKKLVIWNNSKQIDTFAMREFKKMYDNKSYPGLGYIKKLSIMHHIELVNDYLEAKNNENM